MTTTFNSSLDYAATLSAIRAAIAGGADNWQAPADWQPGDYDGSWEHSAAAEARRLTTEAGETWEFTTWAQALHYFTRRAAED
jgi:hypothetical protein